MLFTKIFFINDFGLLAWLQFLHLEQCQPRQAWILSWSLPLYLHDQRLWGRDSWWVREAPQWNRYLHRKLTTAPLASVPVPFWEVNISHWFCIHWPRARRRSQKKFEHRLEWEFCIWSSSMDQMTRSHPEVTPFVKADNCLVIYT